MKRGRKKLTWKRRYYRASYRLGIAREEVRFAKLEAKHDMREEARALRMRDEDRHAEERGILQRRIDELENELAKRAPARVIASIRAVTGSRQSLAE